MSVFEVMMCIIILYDGDRSDQVHWTKDRLGVDRRQHPSRKTDVKAFTCVLVEIMAFQACQFSFVAEPCMKSSLSVCVEIYIYQSVQSEIRPSAFSHSPSILPPSFSDLRLALPFVHHSLPSTLVNKPKSTH